MLHLRTAGSNAQGQLATDSLDDSMTLVPVNFRGYTPESLPDTTTRVLDLAFGANHTLLLLSQRQAGDNTDFNVLWGSGDGEKGQLGPAIASDGNTTIFDRVDLLSLAPDLEGYSYRLIAAAWETSYVVLSHETRSDILISIGANDFGDLGVRAGSKTNSSKIHRLQLGHIQVDGTSLDHYHLRVEQIRSGPHHVIAIVKATSLSGSTRAITLGWGAARHGQLGARDKIRQVDIPQVIPIEAGGSTVVGIGAGNQHTALRHSDGRLSIFGSSRKGQWNDTIRSLHNVSGIGCTWHGTYVLCTESDETYIMATGSNSHCQLGSLSNHTRPMPLLEFLGTKQLHSPSLTCGSEHVLVWGSATSPQDDCREVWGWGWNEHGNLAIGSTENLPTPRKIFSGDDERVVGVWAGCATTWIATETVP